MGTVTVRDSRNGCSKNLSQWLILYFPTDDTWMNAISSVPLANHLRAAADAFRPLRTQQWYWTTERWTSPKKKQAENIYRNTIEMHRTMEIELNHKTAFINSVPRHKEAYRKSWTLDAWSGHLDPGRLGAWTLDVWTLDAWTLDDWTLDAWTLGLWTLRLRALGPWTTAIWETGRLDSGRLDYTFESLKIMLIL